MLLHVNKKSIMWAWKQDTYDKQEITGHKKNQPT